MRERAVARCQLLADGNRQGQRYEDQWVAYGVDLARDAIKNLDPTVVVDQCE